MKGVIIKLNGNKAYIMTDTMGFYIVEKRLGMLPGQHIEFTEQDILSQKPALVKHKPILSFIAACIILILIPLSMYNFIFVPEKAYVTLDINPSIEFSINMDGKIVDFTELNTSAQRVQHGLRLKGMNLVEAFNKIIEASYQEGYLEKAEKHVIVIGFSSSIENQKDCVKIFNELAGMIENRYKFIETGVLYSSLEERQESEKYKLSVNKYKILKWAESGEYNLKIGNIEEVSIHDLIQKLPEKPHLEITQFLGLRNHLDPRFSKNNVKTLDSEKLPAKQTVKPNTPTPVKTPFATPSVDMNKHSNKKVNNINSASKPSKPKIKTPTPRYTAPPQYNSWKRNTTPAPKITNREKEDDDGEDDNNDEDN
ncbi:MAG: anti-sigma factor domain-containing protein [Clostridia bacterium]|nr:anti-sigma factor domain-containing protein [Clostridia bacterium]